MLPFYVLRALFPIIVFLSAESIVFQSCLCVCWQYCLPMLPFCLLTEVSPNVAFLSADNTASQCYLSICWPHCLPMLPFYLLTVLSPRLIGPVYFLSAPCPSLASLFPVSRSCYSVCRSALFPNLTFLFHFMTALSCSHASLSSVSTVSQFCLSISCQHSVLPFHLLTALLPTLCSCLFSDVCPLCYSDWFPWEIPLYVLDFSDVCSLYYSDLFSWKMPLYVLGCSLTFGL